MNLDMNMWLSIPGVVTRPWWDRQARPLWLRRLSVSLDFATDAAVMALIWGALSVGHLSPVIAPLFLVVALSVGLVGGVYRLDVRASRFERGLEVAEAQVVALALLIVVGAIAAGIEPSRAMFATWAVSGVALLAKRWLVNVVDVLAWRRGIGVSRVLFAGADGESGRRLMQAVVNDPRLGSHLVGYLSDTVGEESVPIATEHRIVSARRLGPFDDMVAVARRHRANEVIVVLPPAESDRVARLVADGQAAELIMRIAPNLEDAYGRATVAEVAGIPVISFDHEVMTARGIAFKRSVDIILAVFLLALVSVPMLAIACLIRLDSRGPALYRQPRVGKNGRRFDALKFRTMVDGAERLRTDLIANDDAADPRLFKHTEDPRLTRAGRWLRRWSMDEIPQLWNILRGEMSVVGPRPPLPDEVAHYLPVHRQRLAVVPGLTGLWQVNGRSNLSFEEMIRLDLYYVETWTPWLDLKLLMRTIPAVLSGRGAY